VGSSPHDTRRVGPFLCSFCAFFLLRRLLIPFSRFSFTSFHVPSFFLIQPHRSSSVGLPFKISFLSCAIAPESFFLSQFLMTSLSPTTLSIFSCIGRSSVFAPSRSLPITWLTHFSSPGRIPGHQPLSFFSCRVLSLKEQASCRV